MKHHVISKLLNDSAVSKIVIRQSIFRQQEYKAHISI